MNEVINFNLQPFGLYEKGVDARELHGQLKVATRFNDWIIARLQEAQLVEDQDFIIFTENPVKINKRGRPPKEYVLSIDATKHISMMERTKLGRRIRQYFIDMEKREKSLQRTEFSTQREAMLEQVLLNQSEIINQYMSAMDDLGKKYEKLLDHHGNWSQAFIRLLGKELEKEELQRMIHVTVVAAVKSVFQDIGKGN